MPLCGLGMHSLCCSLMAVPRAGGRCLLQPPRAASAAGAPGRVSVDLSRWMQCIHHCCWCLSCAHSCTSLAIESMPAGPGTATRVQRVRAPCACAASWASLDVCPAAPGALQLNKLDGLISLCTGLKAAWPLHQRQPATSALAIRPFPRRDPDQSNLIHI